MEVKNVFVRCLLLLCFALIQIFYGALRGEEEAPDNPKGPKQELTDRLGWAYDPAPYISGYYAI